MTAEIVVMNRAAAVLAADSAVTITGQKTPKVYRTAKKLFQLTPHASLGAMIYNTTEICGLPWETVLGEYRAQLTGAPPDTVSDWVDDLVGFLTANRDLFPPKQQHAIAQRIVYRRQFALKARVNEAREKNRGLPSSSRKTPSKLLEAVVQEEVKELRKAKMCSGFDSQFEEEFARKHRDWVLEAAEYVFERKRFPAGVRDLLCEIAALCFSRDKAAAYHTGLVLAGFGARQMLPAFREIHVEAMVEDRLKWCDKRREEISLDQPSSIVPFAQDEVVDTLIKGVNPRFHAEFLIGALQLIAGTIDSVIDDLPQLTATQKDGEKKKARKQVLSEWKDYFDRMDGFRDDKFEKPVRRALSVLPKNELAAVAEALVSITSLRQLISEDMETVGGPVDVAVVSKRDGFVWHRQKAFDEGVDS